MKRLILFATFVVAVLSDDSLSDPGVACIYEPADIKYLFYNIQNPVTPIIIPSDNFSGIKDTHFNKLKDTLFLVHGSGGDTSGPLTQKVRNATVNRGIDINLVAVDWQQFELRQKNISVYDCAPLFGQIVGRFLNELANVHGMKYGDLSMVGHSIASKFCIQISMNLPNKLKTFFGIESSSTKGMNAEYTELIFTGRGPGGGHGKINFYPNGGSNQPNCPPPPDWGCNHWRVIDLFAESLYSDKFVSRECDTWENYQAGKCNNNTKAIMGGLNPDQTIRGHFYLYTNGESPFAKG